ncbi:MAG: glycine zipper 2TM domain-containing protein [Rhizobacter sp.]|nr:glycine zipper 2TM domain-containing protein [Ferruginibacter sp.]
MKKLLLPLAIASAVIFTACGDKKEETNRDMVLLTDSSHNNSLSSDTATMQQTAPVAQEPLVTAPPVRSTNQTPRKTTNKYNQPVPKDNSTTQAPVVTPDPQTPVVTPAPSTETAGTGTTGTETVPAAEPAKKKGISNSAKGAIIGGVGGAVAGAVIGKGGKGAVIGGVIGAAGGYILGRKKDKKAADTSGN